jgi:hypothetical protein
MTQGGARSSLDLSWLVLRLWRKNRRARALHFNGPSSEPVHLNLRLILIAIAGIALCASLTLCVKAAKPEVRTVPAAGVDAALQELWGNAVPATPKNASRKDVRDWQMKLATWLPSEWPPTPRTVWTRYAYGLDVTLDGAAGVSAPFARIERRAGDDPNRVIVPMSQGVKAIATHPVRPHGGWNYTLEDEQKILRRVLELTSTPSETKQIAAYYHAWQLGSAEIAAQVASRHEAFFDWLKTQP